jgi:hypothetical protein
VADAYGELDAPESTLLACAAGFSPDSVSLHDGSSGIHTLDADLAAVDAEVESHCRSVEHSILAALERGHHEIMIQRTSVSANNERQPRRRHRRRLPGVVGQDQFSIGSHLKRAGRSEHECRLRIPFVVDVTGERLGRAFGSFE